jgi:hypothetical protein
MLGHRAVFDRVGFDEGQPMAVTTDWLARARADGVTFRLSDQVVLQRRIRAGSLTTDVDAYGRALLGALRDKLARGRPSR